MHVHTTVGITGTSVTSSGLHSHTGGGGGGSFKEQLSVFTSDEMNNRLFEFPVSLGRQRIIDRIKFRSKVRSSNISWWAKKLHTARATLDLST